MAICEKSKYMSWLWTQCSKEIIRIFDDTQTREAWSDIDNLSQETAGSNTSVHKRSTIKTILSNFKKTLSPNKQLLLRCKHKGDSAFSYLE